MSGNGLQIQILKKMKMNLKLKSNYNNNRKISKLKEIKICQIYFQMTITLNNKQHVYKNKFRSLSLIVKTSIKPEYKFD